jgi:hypothetical protein
MCAHAWFKILFCKVSLSVIVAVMEYESLEVLFNQLNLTHIKNTLMNAYHSSDAGRPPFNPLELLRFKIIYYLKGYRSQRALEREVSARIDDFLIGYCQRINKRDFTVKVETVNRRHSGKREVLNKSETSEILRELNRFFETMVEVKRIRNEKHQTIETLIKEEAQLYTKYLRGKNNSWPPHMSVN